MRKIKTALKRGIKVQAIREVILMFLVLLFVPVIQMLNELSKASNWGNIIPILTDNPALIVILIIEIGCVITLIVFIHKIDKWTSTTQDKKDDERAEKIIKAIRGLRKDLKRYRNERNDNE